MLPLLLLWLFTVAVVVIVPVVYCCRCCYCGCCLLLPLLLLCLLFTVAVVVVVVTVYCCRCCLLLPLLLYRSMNINIKDTKKSFPPSRCKTRMSSIFSSPEFMALAGSLSTYTVSLTCLVDPTEINNTGFNNLMAQ